MTRFAELGRITKLSVLDFGEFTAKGQSRAIGIMGFLLTTDLGKHILVDTGLPPGYTADPLACARLDGLDALGEVTRISAENSVAGQLALLGLTPDDIALTILSHSHIDRVGGLAALTHAPILMTAAERANPRPLYHGDHRPLDWPEAEYVLIDDDTEICDGLIAVPTPGHTLGHLSMLLVLPQTGPAILTGDALERYDQLMNGFDGADDEALASASADRLLAFAQQGAELVIYGHCPGQWQQIGRAPYSYS